MSESKYEEASQNLIEKSIYLFSSWWLQTIFEGQKKRKENKQIKWIKPISHWHHIGV